MTPDPSLDPVMVKNPHTGRYVNIAPLFLVVSESFDNDIGGLSRAIDSAIRAMVLHIDSDHSGTNEFRNNVFIMFKIKDIFNGFSELS